MGIGKYLVNKDNCYIGKVQISFKKAFDIYKRIPLTSFPLAD
jgi:hypothetical protein